jgi:ABC-type dipeptide/oligopeptide/nickel transport system permease subunit
VAITSKIEPSSANLPPDWQLSLSRWWERTSDVIGKLGRQPLAVIGAVILLGYLFATVAAPLITWHDPALGNLRQRFLPPVWLEGGSWDYPLGTDAQGRDLWARIVYGSRASLVVGFLAVLISVAVGTILGALSGYYQGQVDAWLSRLSELLLAFPYLIFAIGVMAFLGPGFRNLILALTFKGWVEFFRLVRGEVLAEKQQEYVEAARVVGQPHARIIRREVLPNVMHSVVVLGTLRLGHMIMMEASLSFLGLGIQPPTPAWGSMVATGRDYLLNAWWVSTLPGIAILVLVLAVNLLGEGLRDVLDPRFKESLS